MAAQRKVILPALLLALGAALLFSNVAFTGVSRPVTGTNLRAGGVVASQALPLEAVESSISTALTVQTAGWWANIFFVVIPCGFLVTLYLQSERSKLEE
eukprot:CAMPEP_0178401494 /NCGR_PEP_ID=MMETSP0689_2-20121128/16330_1 /TAXON_ID=160604 /ORGANISM="Amphidinium massartii, Strain CS-259" /LENGTH=98 /DNA_ID=CAMNT_0020022315 /DNA_START=77 /DNA_END=373 /DNA_ORIENTATION=+